MRMTIQAQLRTSMVLYNIKYSVGTCTGTAPRKTGQQKNTCPLILNSKAVTFEKTFYSSVFLLEQPYSYSAALCTVHVYRVLGQCMPE